MNKIKLKHSGIYIPELVLGTFAMGGGTSWQDTTESDEELAEFIKYCHSIGVSGIDTAPVYGCGRSERIVASAVKGCREDWYISTKCCKEWRDSNGDFQYTRDGFSVYNNYNKKSIIQDVEDSLSRLDIDYIDMEIVHNCPPVDRIPETMEALMELKDRGLIKAIGVSNIGLTEDPLTALNEYMKYGVIDLIQEKASLLDRKNLKLFLKTCEENDIVFQNYGGLDKGALAGKFVEGITEKTGDNRSKYKWFQPEGENAVRELTASLQSMAEKYRCSVPVLYLAWLKAQSSVVDLLVGARRKASIDDTLNVINIQLSAEDAALMEKLAATISD